MASSILASSTAETSGAGGRARAGAHRVRLDGRLVVGVVALGVVAVAAALAPLISPGDPTRLGTAPFEAPGAVYRFGTDDMGRDVLGGLVHGARISLAVGLAAATASTLLGVVIGATAGFFGGWIDDVLMRMTDLFMILPRFLLALVMVAYFGPSLLNVIVVLGVLSFPMAARLVRGQFLSLREREFVQAARALGAGSVRLITRHLLPNALGPLVISASFQAASAIMSEAGLSFLGLSDPATMSWGRMLQNAQPFLRRAWWLGAFPGLAILVTVVALNLIGDRLEVVSNPRSNAR